MMVRVRAVGENTITVNMGAFEATYLQVEPYVYQIVSAGTALSKDGREIRFRMEGGRPAFISVGNGFDMTALPSGRRTPALAGSLIVVVVAVVFFTVMPVMLLVRFLRKRRKAGKQAISRFNVFATGLLLCGTLLVVNNLVCIARIMVLMFRPFAEMLPHVWANYVLLVASGLLFVASLLSLRREQVGTGRKVMHGVTALVLTLLFVVLGDWNFFVLG